MIEINKNTTCAVTGHRKVEFFFNKQALLKKLEQICENGYDTFLVGMALGFDTLCFKALEKIREKRKIRIIACIPCLEQDKLFNDAQKKEYKKMIESADEKVVLSPHYTKYCMMQRNRYMVDNSSLLLAYLREEKGGTKNTVKYAEKSGKNIIII